MGIRTMKKDLFTIKALESKGFDMDQLLALTDEEVEALPISTKLIEGVIEIRSRGGKTADAIAEEIADLMMREETTEEHPEVLEEYQNVPEEVLEVSEEIEVQDVQEEIEVQEVQEEEVIRVESNADDVAIIKEALKGKDAKSFQPFIKHLKTEVPEAILNSVDSTLVSELIEARIAEVKAEQEKTK